MKPLKRKETERGRKRGKGKKEKKKGKRKKTAQRISSLVSLWFSWKRKSGYVMYIGSNVKKQ